MTQLSSERKGRITASAVHKLLKPKGFGDRGENYLWEVITEILGGEINQVSSKATDYGNEMEQWGLELFQQSTPFKVQEIDFQKDGYFLGASPDGVFTDKKGERCLIEHKAPYNLSNHVKNLKLLHTQEDLKKLHFEYYSQIQLQLHCSKLKTCYFVSFCGLDSDFNFRLPDPADRLKVLKVVRDEPFQSFMSERLTQAISFIQKYT